MAFWKPGAKKPEKPVSLEVDNVEGQGDAGSVFISNQHASLSLKAQRERLPIARLRKELLYLVETHPTTVVVGHTGCGKTTQVPQYLAEAGWAAGGRLVACTQPRRIAAQTVALRVAEEMQCQLGGAVGYSVRFEDVCRKGETKIKYLTDGVLLREMMSDPLLTAYSVIMVDEAHERGLNTDTLLGLLKKVQRRRRDLRLIVASATLNAEHFAEYFDMRTARTRRNPALAPVQDAAVVVGEEPPPRDLSVGILSVEGRGYDVAVHYLQAPASDYVSSAVSTALELHAGEGPGDILVFLTGQGEIERAVEMLAAQGDRRLHPLPLYAGLPHSMQAQVFEGSRRGMRKCIVASAVAETSITLEGVVYVVDCCFAKTVVYDPHAGLEALVVVPATKANATQRAGRAGRLRPGHCFRLCTEAAFDALQEAPVPEMQRSNLTSTVLLLKALGIDNILNFDWLAPPPAEMLVRALELLYALGALDDAARLTAPLGLCMADMPLDPMLAKAVLVSGELQCSEQLATIAALQSVQSVWAPARGQRRALDEAKMRFAVQEGDHVSFLNIYEAFVAHGRSPQWCSRNFLNYKALLRADDIRQQLCKHLRRMGIPLVGSMKDRDITTPVLKALTAGFFGNAVRLDPGKGQGGAYIPLRISATAGAGGAMGLGHETLMHIHPESVLFNRYPQVMIYTSTQRTDRVYMSGLSVIEGAWLVELAPHFYEKKPLRSA